MSRHPHRRRAAAHAILAAAACVAMTASHAADPQIPSDDDRLDGDHLRLRTNVVGFKAVPATANEKSKCAPAGSRIAVHRDTGDAVIVRFLTVTSERDLTTFEADKPALEACKGEDRVNTYTQYTIERSALLQYDYRRTGVSFGGLLVPFKYRVGKSKELVASSAIAPYVGFRTGWFQNFGLTFTPVLAAGLSLVPVADAAAGTTSTRSAYTVAVGVRLSSSKNEAFSAGLLYGRDFLNRADRAADPAVSKPWVSFYVGYAM